MNTSQYELVENNVFNAIKDKLNDLSLFLSKNRFEIGDLSISRNGIDKSYFSDIEIIIWKDNNIESVFSLIIFSEGKQCIEVAKVSETIDKEFNMLDNHDYFTFI
ncbi:MAG: hypothetical protein PHT07_12795 [Paludibacter sp.]|nr:hypothetical protein [Paludibacter sp.]